MNMAADLKNRTQTFMTLNLTNLMILLSIRLIVVSCKDCFPRQRHYETQAGLGGFVVLVFF